MRTILTTTALALAICVSAQTTNTLPEAPAQPVQQSPGALIAQGAQLKNAGIISALLFGAAGAAVASSGSDRTGVAEVGAGIAGLGVVTGVVLTISGNSKQAKAGKLLKARGY